MSGSSRTIELKLTASDTASGVFARAGQNIRRTAKQIAQDGAIYGPQVRPRFDAQEAGDRQREAGVLRARRAMRERERREADLHNRLLVRDAREITAADADPNAPIYGPRAKPKRDAHTQAVRDEQAALIKSWREQAKAARIQEEAMAALVGNPSESENAGRKSGEGTAKGFLHSLKETLGKGSALHETLEVAAGSGAVVGVSLLGEMVGHAAEAAVHFKDELVDGEKPVGKILTEFGESLPLIGGLVGAGASLSEVLTGNEAALRNANKEAAELDDHLKRMSERRIVLGKIGDQVRESLRGFADRRALSGLEGAPAEDRAAELAGEKERREIERKAKENRESLLGANDEKLTAATSAAREAADKLAAAKERLAVLESSPVGSGENDAENHQRAIDRQQEIVNQHQAERDRTAQEKKQLEDAAKKVDEGKTKELNASKSTDDTELKARQALRRRDDTEAQARATFEVGQRESDARAAAHEQALRESGDYYHADLDALRAAGAAREREIVQQAKEEVQARMKALGETQAQAEAVVNPRRDRDVAANAQHTQAAVADRQVQSTREEADAARAFNKQLETAQAEAIASRLRAAGAADDAEKVQRAEAHRQRLQDIDEAARKEAEAHGERSGEIEARRKALRGAEDDSYAASEAAAQAEKAKQFLPSLYGSSGTSATGLSGALSAGAAEAMMGQRGKEDKVASEVKKMNGDLGRLLTDLIAVARGAGTLIPVAAPRGI